MTAILKRTFIELGFYCQKCGAELEAGVAMSTSEYNEARVEVEPCKKCESIQTITSEPVTLAGYTKAIDEYNAAPKKRGRPPKLKIGDAAPAEIVKKRRGRPPKIKPRE